MSANVRHFAKWNCFHLQPNLEKMLISTLVLSAAEKVALKLAIYIFH